MKRNNKKGFTIVELVIVIAVIAILSAVLIPTFGGIIEKAQDSANLQEARNAYTEYLTEGENLVELGDKDLYVVMGTDYYGYNDDGEFVNLGTTTPTGDVVIIDEDGVEQ